jgi:hypothetical protein
LLVYDFTENMSGSEKKLAAVKESERITIPYDPLTI